MISQFFSPKMKDHGLRDLHLSHSSMRKLKIPDTIMSSSKKKFQSSVRDILKESMPSKSSLLQAETLVLPLMVRTQTFKFHWLICSTLKPQRMLIGTTQMLRMDLLSKLMMILRRVNKFMIHMELSAIIDSFYTTLSSIWTKMEKMKQMKCHCLLI